VRSHGQTNRTQNLTWDAFDRLIKVVDRDTMGSGQDWVAVFDGLGRKVRTVTTIVVSNTPITSPASAVTTVDSWFDPLVEFQEMCVAVNGGYFSLKTYGPDANGVYGGLNGVGGLERIETYGQVTPVGILQDYFGNVVGTITNLTVAWNPARFCSYGPVPGYQQSPLSLNTPLAQSVGWRGKHIESVGTFYWGARPYEPASGRFLSHDPQSDAANPGGYSTCGGDLVNYFDSDGRQGFMSANPTPQDYAARQQALNWSMTTGHPYPPGPASPADQSLINRYTATFGLVGSAVETGIGVSASSVGIGVPVTAHGVDHLIANFQQLWTGVAQQSVTSRAVAGTAEAFGASPDAAQLWGTGFDIGASLASGFVRVGPAPTTTWTTTLPAGQGRTFVLNSGDIEVSSLGTSLDQSQALLHEQFHSLLTPSQSSLFGPMAAEVRAGLYSGSQLYRYGEEALAESTAQMGTRSMSGLSAGEALGSRLGFPFNGAYAPMSLSGIAREAAIGAGALGTAGGAVYLWNSIGGSSFDPVSAYGSSTPFQDPVGKFNKHR
jgi:RHS repeat-associated protein